MPDFYGSTTEAVTAYCLERCGGRDREGDWLPEQGGGVASACVLKPGGQGEGTGARVC